MNIFQFLWLARELYYKKGLPDLDKIQSLGLLAVKIGQLHALRLDFLSPEKCQHLASLYRNASQVLAEDIQALIDEQGGPNYRKNFSYFDEKPLATASVGQVYQAKLIGGEKVAVKIIKAKFKKNFINDVKKMRRFFNFVLFLYPKLKSVGNPLGILADIETYTQAELDLRNEAKGRELLLNIYHKHQNIFDLSMLDFHKYYPELSSENILVSEFVDAPSVDELLTEGKFAYDDLLKLFYLQGFYIFVAGTFHGDLHPGNVLYDGRKFYFIDNAFIGKVGDKIRRGLFNFFEALSRYDYPLCAKYLNEMAERQISGSDFKRFEADFLELYKSYTNSTVSQVSLTKQMMLTIKLGVHSGMKFEQGIFSIIRSLMYMDGMVLKCNPQALLVQDMRQFISAYKNYI